MISALERGDDAGYFELCYKLQIVSEHGQMEIRNSPPPPDHSPLKGFANFSRTSLSILELISALEREDDGGHNELS